MARHSSPTRHTSPPFTADVSPAAPTDQRAALARFLRGPRPPTPAIATACVGIPDSPAHRLLLSAIDTPGLDFAPGRELALERQVAALVKYLEAQYADTMSESKVVRQSKGDQHIHLCIYLIDSASVKPAERTQSRPPSADADAAAPEVAVAPADLRVLRRLAARCNVLPVVARADTLTDGALAAVKHAVRRDLRAAGIGCGVFAPQGEVRPHPAPPRPTPPPRPPPPPPSARPGEVIKLRPSRHRSRSRRARSVAPMAGEGNSTRLAAEGGDPARLADAESMPPPLADAESVANVRFAARALARADLGAALPFALIAPEAGARRHGVGRGEGEEEEEGRARARRGWAGSTARARRRQTSRARRAADLKGVFVRRYRWGVVDVLDPRHCDFALMRTAVLGNPLQAQRRSLGQARRRGTRVLTIRPAPQDAHEGGLVREVPGRAAACAARHGVGGAWQVDGARQGDSGARQDDSAPAPATDADIAIDVSAGEHPVRARGNPSRMVQVAEEATGGRVLWGTSAGVLYRNVFCCSAHDIVDRARPWIFAHLHHIARGCVCLC
ncbi:hypothetical protein HDZ31DRAFT_69484 [Schizophyllum fasciatum]